MEKQNGFAWDANKAAANIAKHHGISFEMGMQIFADPKMTFGFSRVESGEDRFLATGAIAFRGRKLVLVVVCSLRDWPGDDYSTTHIISVRPATEKERRRYE